MNVTKILQSVKNEELSISEAAKQLSGFSELGFAKVDTQRKARNGYPEVIYGEGKTVEQIVAITEDLLAEGKAILSTRVSAEKVVVLEQKFPDGIYHKDARCFVLNPSSKLTDGYIAIVTAGTSG